MKRPIPIALFLIWSIVCSTTITALLSPSSQLAAQAAAKIEIFSDAMASNFKDWSWGADVVTVNGEWKIHINDGWGALRVHTDTAIKGVSAVVFNARGSGQDVNVSFETNTGTFTFGETIKLIDTMQEYRIEYEGASVVGVAWQDGTGNGHASPFYIDDIYLQTSGGSPPRPVPTSSGSASVELYVDADDARGEINPHVYGMSFADPDLGTELDLPINRWGGNATTRYNWKESVSNRASDWYFLNVEDGPSQGVDENNLPDTATSNSFIEQNLASKTDTLLTIPMIGWTPNGRNSDCGFPVSRYGSQNSVEPYHPNCGDGIDTSGASLYGSTPEDTSIAIDETYTQEWMRYLGNRYGKDAVRFYALDNEPMLWNKTHRDVHPEAVGYEEIRDLTYQYAPAIKRVDPQAQTLGPVVWGWTAYEFSAKDLADGGSEFWLNPPDRNKHGGKPFLAWYLEQMEAYEAKNGQRILDYLDIHYYPQAGGVALSSDVSPQTQALRLRTTRSLWDPTYVDESWIGEEAQLIPRMHKLIADEYPGTKLALTEYNWGAENHINGALTQADILGIFGREGLDMAMFWAEPDPSAPISYAFRMYRNYDGAGGKFGGQSVAATSTDQDKVSVYAAKRQDGALTIMIINKSMADTEVALNVKGKSGSAAVYQYSGSNLKSIQQLADHSPGNTIVLPRDSMQILVMGGNGGGNPAPVVTPTPIATLTKPSPSPLPTPAPPRPEGPRNISGQVFVDENGNGQYDDGERVFPDIFVILIDSSTEGQTLAITTQTDQSGYYEFVAVPPSNYVISYAVPSGFVAMNGNSFEVDTSDGDVTVEGNGILLDDKQFDKDLFLPLTVK